MDLAYICEWEKRPKSNHCPSIPLVCAWSCRNLIAFTTDLKNEEEKGISYYVGFFAIDITLNTFWDMKIVAEIVLIF